jgi:hypothetical protein
VKSFFLPGFCSAVLAATFSQLQAQPAGPAPGLPSAPSEAVISKLFSGQSPFKAQLQLQILSSGMNMLGEGDFACLDGKTWHQMTRTTAFMVLPDGRTNRMQMDKGALASVLSIYRPDKQAAYQVVPRLRAYVETPHGPDGKGDGDLQLARTDAGKETIEGHPCVKYAVVATEKSGKKHELTQWCATDLKEFPVRIEAAVGATTYQFTFRDIQFTRPDDALFEVPSNFTKHAEMGELMMSNRDALGPASTRKKP